MLIAGGFVALLVTVLIGVAPWTVLVALVTLPMAVRAVRLALSAKSARALNFVLFRTAILHMRFGLLMAAGLAAGLLVQ
jgi:1,4-dihydroxy-2-naphthoate octaprenyltransferase